MTLNPQTKEVEYLPRRRRGRESEGLSPSPSDEAALAITASVAASSPPPAFLRHLEGEVSPSGVSPSPPHDDEQGGRDSDGRMVSGACGTRSGLRSVMGRGESYAVEEEPGLTTGTRQGRAAATSSPRSTGGTPESVTAWMATLASVPERVGQGDEPTSLTLPTPVAANPALPKPYVWRHNRPPTYNKRCRETFVPPHGTCPVCGRKRLFGPTARPHVISGRITMGKGKPIPVRCRKCGDPMREEGRPLEERLNYASGIHAIIVCERCGWTWWLATVSK